MDGTEQNDLPEGVRRVTTLLKDKGHPHICEPTLEILAVQAVLARARLARDTAQPVPSPCNSVCRMDEVSGWCAGCYRSIEEISNWSRMAPTEQRGVWALIEQRATPDNQLRTELKVCPAK